MGARVGSSEAAEGPGGLPEGGGVFFPCECAAVGDSDARGLVAGGGDFSGEHCTRRV